MTSGTGVIAGAADRAVPLSGDMAGRALRADDVLALQRAARKGGSRAVLGWLSERSRADVLLVAADGAVIASGRRLRHATDEAVWKAIRCGVGEFARRRVGSMAIDARGHTVVLYPLNGSPGPAAPVLVAVAPQPGAGGLASLLADAAHTLGLCWRAEQTERLRSRLETAESRTREAVLQLLMNGQTEAAQAVAGALRPQLPETIRVWVIEGAPCLRDEVAAHLKASAPGAWIVPCGVCDELLIVLAPVTGDATTAGPPSLECVQAAIEECWVGVSDPVALADTATGYAQAFHALAAAHHRSGRQAAFASSPDLALAIGPAVADWAEHFLAPLRTHSPRRSQDPGSTELLATAASWLSFSSQATKHLEIHRNTLSARLKRIGDQLHLDLDRLSDQSALALAVRTFTAPHPTGGTPAQAQRSDEAPLRGLDGLLAQPAVAQWARSQFQPLTVNGRPTDLARTLTVWLHHNACVEATAAALSLSTTAVRKRLTRAEELMQRFLLRSPTARHDLYLAQRALDLARPAGTRTNESSPPAPSDRLTRSGWRAERPG